MWKTEIVRYSVKTSGHCQKTRTILWFQAECWLTVWVVDDCVAVAVSDAVFCVFVSLVCSLNISLYLLVVCVSWAITGQPRTASSSAECSRDKPPFSFVRGQDSTMWDIVWPQGHRSVSVSRHFLLQAPQRPCSVRKRFSRDLECHH